MKKIVGAHFLFLLLLVALITPVHAQVTFQAIIDQDVHVAFDFEIINETIYSTIKRDKLIAGPTIPNIILDNLKQQDLTHVGCYYEEPVFTDPAEGRAGSIHVTFSLYDSDILNFTVNTKSMIRTYYVRTDWRKFYVNITDEFSLDFAKYFGKPAVHEWQRINYTLNGKTHPAYYHNSTGSLCYFILPAAATNVKAVKDTIIFDLPMPFEDSLLNSPFLILGAIIVVIIASSLYRKVRK